MVLHVLDGNLGRMHVGVGYGSLADTEEFGQRDEGWRAPTDEMISDWSGNK